MVEIYKYPVAPLPSQRPDSPHPSHTPEDHGSGCAAWLLSRFAAERRMYAWLLSRFAFSEALAWRSPFAVPAFQLLATVSVSSFKLYTHSDDAGASCKTPRAPPDPTQKLIASDAVPYTHCAAPAHGGGRSCHGLGVPLGTRLLWASVGRGRLGQDQG